MPMREEDDKTPSEGRARVAFTIPPDSSDEAVRLGQVLAACARNERSTHQLALQVGTLSRELSQHRRDLEDEQREQREHAQRASERASKQTSNRMAALLGALFVLWQEASPMLHELWKMVHR